MTLLSILGGIGLLMVFMAAVCFKQIINKSLGAPLIESFIQLLSQAINEFLETQRSLVAQDPDLISSFELLERGKSALISQTLPVQTSPSSQAALLFTF